MPGNTTSFSIKLPDAAITAPQGSDTVTLFSSVTAWGARMRRHLPVKRISFGVENSHGGTLIFEVSNDGGATWDVYESRSVTAPAANNISGPYDYLIDVYDDVRLRWTNGGTNQTTWRPFMFGHEDRVPGT